jgi:predicted AlkP superfamily pyrophosphatase or phosphodiesterase
LRGSITTGHHRSRAVALAVLLACAWGCASRGPAPAAAPPTLVLVSLDGFRSDYFDRLPTPTLHRLAAHGVRAQRLIPSFPSKTFPNHFTIVTGRWPAHQGIVANDMYDPDRQAWFTLSDPKALRDPHWWTAEPIWVTAEKQGMRTASVFWPGSEAPIDGVLPSTTLPFDAKVTAEQRVQHALDALAAPAPARPRLVTLYLQDTDDVGHEFGPDAPQTAAAVARVDAAVGALLAGIERLGLAASTNVVVLADHGMVATPPQQAIYLDDYVDPKLVKVVTWSPVLELWPEPDAVDAVYAKLHGANPHLAVYRREELPPQLHYAGSDRIPPIVAIAEEGWRITTHTNKKAPSLAEHGYDPRLPSMGALFVAAGPAFAHGRVVAPFDNVAVYPLLCAALGIAPLPGDWNGEPVPDVLAAGAHAPRATSAGTAHPSR